MRYLENHCFRCMPKRLPIFGNKYTKPKANMTLWRASHPSSISPSRIVGMAFMRHESHRPDSTMYMPATVASLFDRLDILIYTPIFRTRLSIAPKNHTHKCRIYADARPGNESGHGSYKPAEHPRRDCPDTRNWTS